MILTPHQSLKTTKLKQNHSQSVSCVAIPSTPSGVWLLVGGVTATMSFPSKESILLFLLVEPQVSAGLMATQNKAYTPTFFRAPCQFRFALELNSDH